MLAFSLNLQNHLAAVPTSQSTSAVTSLLQGAVPKPAEFPTVSLAKIGKKNAYALGLF